MTRGPNADQREFWNAAPGEQWAERQPELDAFHAEATEVLLDACAPRPGERVLDVGCGAGASSFALAEAVGPSGRVLGVDLSAPLLRRAEERRRALGARAVRFEMADAQDHPFEAGAFDLAASRFGLMFFADPVAGFRNVAAALRPGGRLAFVAWSGPEDNPWFTLPREVATARLGPVEAPPADAPGPMAFRDRGRVERLLREAGFADALGRRVAVRLHHPEGAEGAAALASRIGPVASVLREREASPEDRAAIHAALVAALGGFAAPDGLRIPAGLNLFTARRG